ncbi:hypothetical protein Tco_1377235 [Tanacetum coccineum]
MFELYCRSLGISPTVNLFRIFYKISKQGHWFSFEKRVGKKCRGPIPNAMAWRHHDSDVNDILPDNDFSIMDVIDLRPVHPDVLFVVGLATTWDFPSFLTIFKDTEGNGKERKKAQAARAAAKKKGNLKGVDDEEGIVPLNSVASVHSGSAGQNTEEQDAQEDEHHSAPHSPRKSTDECVHNFINVDDGKKKESPPRLEPFVNQSGRPITVEKEEMLTGRNVEEGESSHSAAIYVLEWTIPRRCRVDTTKWGAMAQTDMLERFENLLEDYNRLADSHAECSNTVRNLVTAVTPPKWVAAE